MANRFDSINMKIKDLIDINDDLDILSSKISMLQVDSNNQSDIYDKIMKQMSQYQ